MPVPSPYAARLDHVRVRRDEAEVLGGRTAYWTYGPEDAETTVLAVHGFRGDHHGLESVVAFLPGVRVIMPGREHDIDAYAQWLTAFADQVAPGAVILGHSFGSIVVSAAVAGGLRTPRLILVNPIGAPALEGPKAVLTRLAILYYALGARLPERAGTELLRNRIVVRIMSLAMVKTSDPAVRRFVHDQHDTYFSDFADREVLREAFVTSVSHDVREYAPHIAVPTLLVAAQRDDITPIEAERALAPLFPDATLVEIAHVGHLIHYEAPAEAAAAIRRFLVPLAVPAP
jgi:pimeloyl-ACP methyl ester carboxylesterase